MIKINAGKKGRKPLREFVKEVKSVTVGEEWKISAEYVLDHFKIAKEDYFRFLYASNEPEADHFSQANADLLVHFLSECGIPGVLDAFSDAGYLFRGEQLAEFQELFCSVTMTRFQNHMIDRELLETSLSGCSEISDGLSFYCDSVFDLRELIDFSISLYLERISCESHPVSRGILNNFIVKQFAYGYLKYEDLLAGLKSCLKEKAVVWNFISPDSGVKSVVSREIMDSLRILEFAGNRMPDESEIKNRYRELVKKYHPDINPDGDEKARLINSAYTEILNYRIARNRGDAVREA